MSTSTSGSPSSIDFASLLAEFDASGQSAAAFARSRGIASWRIYHALNRRKGRVRPRPGLPNAGRPTFVPVQVIPAAAPERAAATLLIELVGGHRLRIGPDFDAVLLRRVLAELAQC